MANNEQILLKQIIDEQHRLRNPDVTSADFFEMYVAEQVLKDGDLSDDEIEYGLVGGANDGGIDGIYTFVNGELIQEDFDFSGLKKNISIETIIIQAKATNGYGEDVINKLIATTNNLLDLNRQIDEFRDVYNESVRSAFSNFRRLYLGVASKFPDLSFRYIYATQGDSSAVHVNTRRKASDLQGHLLNLFKNASFKFEFIGASDLIQLARRRPITSYEVEISEGLSVRDGYIALIKLGDFHKFIQNDSGQLNKSIFEANVRDYQGNNQVNEDMQQTLSEPTDEDFWWLNNGVTVVASKAVQGGKTLTIEDPQIVNGQQTSTEIFNYFQNKIPSNELRSVMVRVIVANDPISRDRIIKATNSQTAISAASLRATDKIHRDIEGYLSQFGLYYDRRKNSQKQLGRPVGQIVSIALLAQSMMAMYLRRPADARARPSTLIKSNQDYESLFDSKIPINVYLVAAKLVKSAHAYLKKREDLQQKDRTNLLFYLVMHTSSCLVEESKPTLKKLSEIDLNMISESLFDESLLIVQKLYMELGGNDGVAKGGKLTDRIQLELDNQFKKIIPPYRY